MTDHRATAAVVKGSGLSSRTGGFTRLMINGKAYHPDDVARAVETHSDLLHWLKGIARRLADHNDLSETERTELSLAFAAIDRAEGRANG